jgi:hypothetical protein
MTTETKEREKMEEELKEAGSILNRYEKYTKPAFCVQ